jgi:hypothetical protein
MTGKATFFSVVIAYVETTHLSYLPSVIIATIATTYKRLSSASRSRMRSESAMPFRTFTLLRIAVGGCSRTIFAQRGSKRILDVRIPANLGNVNWKNGYKIVGVQVTVSTTYVLIAVQVALFDAYA